MIRKRSFCIPFAKQYTFLRAKPVSPSGTAPAGACRAQPGKERYGNTVAERTLSAPSGHLSQRERQDMVVFTKIYSINNLPREDPSSRGCLYTSQFIFGFSRRLRFLGFFGMKIQKITSATMPAASRTHFSITFHLDSVIFGSGSGSG